MKAKPHIPDGIRHPLSDAIDRAIEDHATKRDAGRIRGYLGMSAIGKACARSLWYGFRFASPTVGTHPARTLRNFEDGHRSEDLAAERIKRVPGLVLKTEQDDGNQFGVVDIGGHFRGHCDGFLKGVPGEDPEKVFLWEHKTCSASVYNKLKKLIKDANGNTEFVIQEWNDIYYFQVQTYISQFNALGMNMTQSIHTVDGSGGREETLVVKTPHDPMLGEAMRAKAKTLIFAKDPSQFDRVASDPSAYDCMFCDHKEVCFTNKTMERNCRTCLHSTPMEDGDASWWCGRHSKYLSMPEQLKGCPSYDTIPNTG